MRFLRTDKGLWISHPESHEELCAMLTLFCDRWAALRMLKFVDLDMDLVRAALEKIARELYRARLRLGEYA